MAEWRDSQAGGVTMLEPRERTVPGMVRAGARHGARVLARMDGTAWRFDEIGDVAARSAGRLAAAGVGRGDRVALMCGNRAALIETVLGCGWLGAIAVPINTASRGPSLAHVLSNAGARLVIVEPELRPFLPTGAAAIWHADALPPPGEALPAADIRPGDPLAILYTSGTTGPSKGVICPHAQFHWWGTHAGALLGIGAGDVLATSLPLFHTNALNAFFQALLHGATLDVAPRFTASGFWRLLVESRATVTYVLGAMVPILLARPPGPEERAHTVRVALAPGVPAHLHAAFTQRTGIALLDGYGSTETNFVLGCAVAAQRPGCMGPVVPGFAARVLDDDDTEVADGVAGELALRADEPFAFASGYWAMPEKTVEAWRNLWFHTGDRVVREADGYFRFVDRLKDAIRRRGENISSFEVEQVLQSHPGVAGVAVFPARSELAEDEVMAAIVPRAGMVLDPVELVRFCEGKLAYFAVPRFIDFVDTLPMTENGKVRKFALIARGVAPATWDRDAAGVVVRR